MEDIVIYKIYRLYGSGLNYFGSTHQKLHERKSSHKTDFNKKKHNCCASKEIIGKGNWDIEIVEILPNSSTEKDALEREKFWINNNDCVNKYSPIRTKDELQKYNKDWATELRRSKGIKERVIGFDNKEYQCKWAKDKRDNMTPEEKEEYLKHRRESRKPQTEEQKVKARERAQKQRDSKKDVL